MRLNELIAELERKREAEEDCTEIVQTIISLAGLQALNDLPEGKAILINSPLEL